MLIYPEKSSIHTSNSTEGMGGMGEVQGREPDQQPCSTFLGPLELVAQVKQTHLGNRGSLLGQVTNVLLLKGAPLFPPAYTFYKKSKEIRDLVMGSFVLKSSLIHY